MSQQQDQEKDDRTEEPASSNHQQSAPITIILQEISGTVAVTEDVGSKILLNLLKQTPPFKPELGLGRCTWILIAGCPYTGITKDKNVIIPTRVEIPDDLELLLFQEEDLLAIFNEKRQALEQTALQDYANFHNLSVNQLNRRQRRNALYRVKAAAEKKMWIAIGTRVSGSAQKVGRVELRNSMFSKQGDGEFLLVADGNLIEIIGDHEVVKKALEDRQKQ